MTFTTGGRTVRFIEHTPGKWAEFVRSRSPIVESIVPLSSSGQRKAWNKMDNGWLLQFAQDVVDKSDVKGRNELEQNDLGLYRVLSRRKLLDRIGFRRDERSWSRYSDDELVTYAQTVVDKGRFDNRSGLKMAEGGLYNALVSRMLLERVQFKVDRRDWRGETDNELVEFAQRLVEESGIVNRTGLKRADGGLYKALYKRKLTERVEFVSGKRLWREYSDDGLVDYAQEFVEEHGIRNRSELAVLDAGLYDALKRRKLIGRVFSILEQDKESDGLAEISEALREFGGEECD